MSERGHEVLMNSPEALLEVAQRQFGVDLRNAGAVHAKAQELNEAARLNHDYSQINELTRLFNQYQELSLSGTVEKKAA